MFRKPVSGGTQQCTVWMCTLSISGLWVSTNHLMSWIKYVWFGRVWKCWCASRSRVEKHCWFELNKPQKLVVKKKKLDSTIIIKPNRNKLSPHSGCQCIPAGSCTTCLCHPDALHTALRLHKDCCHRRSLRSGTVYQRILANTHTESPAHVTQGEVV